MNIFHCFSEKIRLDVSSDSSAGQRIHMKNQALFSSKDKSKKLKCCMLQFLFGALRVNRTYHIEQSGHVFSITDILFATFLDCTHHDSQGISSELAGQILQMWFLPTTINKINF